VEDNPKSIAEFLMKHNETIDKHELGELLGGNAEQDIEITYSLIFQEAMSCGSYHLAF